MKTVVLGITSGIAAFRSLELIKLLQKEEIDVWVMMTKSAKQMVKPQEFENASGHKVYYELFESNFDYKQILTIRKVDHIELADKADIVVIAPTTANTIAKIAYGIADDFFSTTLLATSAPIIICPSMNVHMWENPVVQENLKKLKGRGFIIIDPEKGRLACGYEGQGRLAHIETIKNEILRQLNRSRLLSGKRVLVTAGGTIEKIDDVRFIDNRSSGKMGVAIAQECYMQGADVFLLRAKNSVSPRYTVKEKLFETADDLSRLIKTYIKACDIVFHTAAVSDFTPEKRVSGKISSNESFTLHLIPQKKILNEIKKLNPSITLIAFKAEWGLTEKDLVKKAYQKLQESNADIVVANDISQEDRGFEVDTNEVFLVFSSGKYKKIPLSSKSAVARGILDCMIKQKFF